MVKKISYYILQFFIASVFIFSAFTKLFPVESFELNIATSGIIGWALVPYFARIFIGIEAILGFFLILNLKPKFVLKSIIGVLIFFTLYLVYIWFKNGENIDCGCFGEFVSLNIKESIIKNIILLVLSFLVLKNLNPFNLKYQKIIIPVLIVSMISLPFILTSVVPVKYNDDFSNNATYKLDVNSLGEFNYNGKIYDLSTGKKIICFMSLTCKFCKLAAKKITIINKNLDGNLPIFYVLGGSEKYLETFWEESNSEKFPYLLLQPSNENNIIFFNLSGSVLPSIYFLEDGIVKKKVHFENLEQSIIEDFMNK